MKVELIGKYNMSIGTVLLITSENVLRIGDKIQAGNEDYEVKGFLHPTGAYNEKMISVLV